MIFFFKLAFAAYMYNHTLLLIIYMYAGMVRDGEDGKEGEEGGMVREGKEGGVRDGEEG